jgi:rubrerythrin
VIVKCGFPNPFPGKVGDGPMSAGDLVRALRQDIADEERAIATYEAQVDALRDTDDVFLAGGALRVLKSLADEERVHVGELQALLAELNPATETNALIEGAQEVEAETRGD